jgi:hypothetical protein
MKTAAEYLTLAERYRLAKLDARDPATRDQLEVFERSYSILARSAQTLARSIAVQDALKRRDK